MATYLIIKNKLTYFCLLTFFKFKFIFKLNKKVKEI